MDTTIFQLRLFVHQRLYRAAEEILGEVEKAITLASHEAEVSRSKEEEESLRHQLDLHRERPAADPSLTGSTEDHGEKCDAALLQENPGPSTPEESTLSLSAEDPGPSQTSTDQENNNWNDCLVETDFKISEIKKEVEEPRDDVQTQDVDFPSPEIVKSEQDQPETQVPYEMQPVSSDCSAAQSGNIGDHELVKSKEDKTKPRRKKGKTLRGKRWNNIKKDHAPLPRYKNEKEYTLCDFCGRRFHYIGSLMKHIKTHESKHDCSICRLKCQSMKQLVAHLKSWHNKTCVCNFCGKIFSKFGFLRHHEKMHQAADPSLTSSTEEHGDTCETPLLQENPGPSTPEESNFSLSAEDPGPSQTSTDVDAKNLNDCFVGTDFKMLEIKGGQEKLWDNSQTQEMDFPSSEIVNSEQDQPETQVPYELQPLSSECSAAQSENDSDEEFNNKGEHTTEQEPQSGGVGDETDQMALLNDKSSAESEKERSFCQFCGKRFQYIGCLLKHIKTHEKKNDCTICGQTCQCTEELIAHVKSHHPKSHFCDVCGKTYTKRNFLWLHERIHIDKKEFACEECGKTFYRKEHLIVHGRTHSGEKPYCCDICGKAYSQSHNLTIHKRSHSGEKPYHCDVCSKRFYSNSHLRKHMKNH
ncbi:zinc finger protein 260-like [Plectropomus leopardus]|uniref:zinc finger protein 260-like n=1 Tax=Plectropomus leopardus TaxID=160734 RepID=UPI001C4B5718|nr:zinc finger protein 260-like [Plectropomus leopardus]